MPTEKQVGSSSGLFSGLMAQDELNRLLDELYGA